MLKLRMNSTHRGVQDPYRGGVELFDAGKEYMVGDEMGSFFVRMGWAELVEDTNAAPFSDPVMQIAQKRFQETFNQIFRRAV